MAAVPAAVAGSATETAAQDIEGAAEEEHDNGAGVDQGVQTLAGDERQPDVPTSDDRPSAADSTDVDDEADVVLAPDREPPPSVAAGQPATPATDAVDADVDPGSIGTDADTDTGSADATGQDRDADRSLVDTDELPPVNLADAPALFDTDDPLLATAQLAAIMDELGNREDPS